MMTTERPFENEIFHVAGDAPSSDHKPTGGVMPGYDLTNTAAAKPVIYWYDKASAQARLLTVDLYLLPDAPAYFVILCPKCHNALRVSQDNKAFTYDLREKPKKVIAKLGCSYVELASYLGLRSIEQVAGVIHTHEPIRCAWETEPELRRTHDAICDWRVVIEDNIAKDAG